MVNQPKQHRDVDDALSPKQFPGAPVQSLRHHGEGSTSAVASS